MNAITAIQEIEDLIKTLDRMETLRLEPTYSEGLSVLRGILGDAKVDKGLAAQQRQLEKFETRYPNEQELRSYVEGEVCRELVLAHLHGMGYKAYYYDDQPVRELLRTIREKRISIIAGIRSEGLETIPYRLVVDGPKDVAFQQAKDILNARYPDATIDMLRFEVG